MKTIGATPSVDDLIGKYGSAILWKCAAQQHPYSNNSFIAPDGGNYSQESPRQPKAVLEKEYRKRESELFDQLRGYIGSMTECQPDTRQGILTEGGFY